MQNHALKVKLDLLVIAFRIEGRISPSSVGVICILNKQYVKKLLYVVPNVMVSLLNGDTACRCN